LKQAVHRVAVLILGCAGLGTGSAAVAQEGAPPAAAPVARAANPFPAGPPLGDGPSLLPTQHGSVRVSVVAKGLERPWAMALLPGGDILLTERPGRLRVIRDGKLDPVAIAGLPPLHRNLMGLALHPDFANNRLIYFAYSQPGDPVRDHATLAVARARWDGGMSLGPVERIFTADAWFGGAPLPDRCCGQGPPAGSFGGRIAFGPDGKLYVASGDRNYGERAQDPGTHLGKILRLNDDGSVPADNPFVSRAGYKPEIFSLGHRNPSALTFDPQTGALWESEFGPRGGDEVNTITPGGNYGWMEVTGGEHYNGEPVKSPRGKSGMVAPALTWPAATNPLPGGMTFYQSDRFAGWQGALLMATMSRSLMRISINAAGAAIEEERLLGELEQRFRDVIMAPDGALYLITDEAQGALLRVEPAE
jgi:glucose/arabinose dehydrogenase